MMKIQEQEKIRMSKWTNSDGDGRMAKERHSADRRHQTPGVHQLVTLISNIN